MEKYLKRLLYCTMTSIVVAGCVRELDSSEMQQESLGEGGGFTLVATYGPADTKVAFEDDELGLMWEPGDKLFLVDVAGKNETIEMITSIVEASKSASFQSSKSVLSGSYFVMSSDTVASITPRNVLSSKEDLKKYLKLYGTLTIEDGQKTATITLNLAYPKLKFNLKNFPAGLSSTAFGMAISQKGIPYKGTLTTDGFVTDTTAYKQILDMGGTSIVDGMSAFMSPYDYTGSTILFYCYGTASDGSHATYEIQKQGINLQAGMNYNVDFDFTQATQSKIVGRVLNTAADFRAAAYWQASDNSYSVGSDVDFSGEICVPILCEILDGNGHTLKNISIDLRGTDYVGLLSQGSAKNLTLEAIDIKGKDHVGGVSGVGFVSNVIVKGTSMVKGRSYIGGVIGSNSSISSCWYEGNVEGKSYVGGLVGRLFDSYSYSYYKSLPSSTSITDSYAKGNVEGKSYVGGLVGEMLSSSTTTSSSPSPSSSSISSCWYEGDVEGESYVGGLAGRMSAYSSNSSESTSIKKCYAKGKVRGKKYAGGLVGEMPNSSSSISSCWYEGDVEGEIYVGGMAGKIEQIEKSYAKGNVSGKDNTGGLVGEVNSVKNSYHIGNVSIEESGKYVGGIAGCGGIYNCYSYGTVTDDIGISYDLSWSSTNLTSCLKLSSSLSTSEYVSCGPEKTFLSKLSVINRDEAYSTQVWEGIDAGCPLLQWQSDALSGEITIPGYGDQDW